MKWQGVDRVEAQDDVERGGPSIIWTSARDPDVGAGKTRKERINIIVKQPEDESLRLGLSRLSSAGRRPH
jgi:hypothetical protein